MTVIPITFPDSIANFYDPFKVRIGTADVNKLMKLTDGSKCLINQSQLNGQISSHVEKCPITKKIMKCWARHFCVASCSIVFSTGIWYCYDKQPVFSSHLQAGAFDVTGD